ncbi:MAG: cytochrome P450 [Coleofasciculaceae cyanobacterium]
MSQDVLELPGPEGNSLVGNLVQLGEDPLSFLTDCASKYGDIIPLRLGLKSACLLTNPDYIEQVLKDRDSFIKSRGLRSLRSLLGEGLLTSEGESWFRQRRLAQPVFQQKRISGYGKAMVEYAEAMANSWQDGQTRDIHEDMMRLTLNIVMKTIFNQEVGEGEARDISHAVDVAMDWFESKRKQGFLILEWFPRPENIRYKNAIKQLDKSVYSIINQRRSSGESPGDLLSMLMEARDQDDNSQMNDKQLRDELITLIIAGHETTSNTLSWTWMLLAQYPEVQAKLLDEIDTVLEGRTPTVADLPRLRYADLVIKESMRLYPAVPTIGREATKDCEIGGYTIPTGCAVIISQWVMHRHPKYFENPEIFQPERWENDLEKRLTKGVYIPFGDGPRICIGKGFALMEAILLLVTIAQKYQLSIVPDFPIVPQPSITLRPEHGLKMVLHKR